MKHPSVPLRLLADPGHFLALGCGSGLLPPAPGTWGTALAVPLWWALLRPLPLVLYVPLLAMAIGLGIWFCGRTAAALGTEDHPAIVWDEFVGFWLACLALPAGWYWMLAAFLLFRLFDIWKPWPIRQLDRRLKGGLGIMLDDLVAGFFAWLLLQASAWLLSAATISA